MSLVSVPPVGNNFAPQSPLSSDPSQADRVPNPPGSLIPKRKPTAQATRIMIAQKLKRRSQLQLRGTANAASSGLLSGRNGQSTNAHANPRVAQNTPGPVQRAVLRNTANIGSTAATRPQVRPLTGATRTQANRTTSAPASRPVQSQAVISGRQMAANRPVSAKAVAEEAMQKKKPAPFVSRKEQQLQKQLTNLEHQKNQLATSLTLLRQEKDALDAKYVELQCTANQTSAAFNGLQVQHSAIMEQLHEAQNELNRCNSELATMTGNLESVSALYEKTIVDLRDAVKENHELRDKLWRFEQERRMLHNKIMELKGNIRVFCRVRPMLSEEFGLITALEIVQFPDDDEDKKKLVIRKPLDATSSKGGTEWKFEFDRVFGPESTQSVVFEEISQLVQSAIDGYNVCVFAYGQTGSGKTFTMEGPPQHLAHMYTEPYGMIELSAQKIFETMESMRGQGWTYTVEASFIEIYNESVLDLLTKDPNNVFNDKLEIRMVSKDNKNDIDVPGVTKYIVASVEELKPLLEIAQQNRTWASTKCNDHSSRSHSIFRLRLCGTNTQRGVTCEGLLSLVDLAGSENIKKSESSGDQLKEAQKINSSLSTLGTVITALQNGDKFIPYRNSKLTYLLQNSLGGNSKTLMFVNINPDPDCANESINSLRFASQVNQCHVGTAKKNVTGKGK